MGIFGMAYCNRVNDEAEEVSDSLGGVNGVGWFLVEGMGGKTGSNMVEMVTFLEGHILKRSSPW